MLLCYSCLPLCCSDMLGFVAGQLQLPAAMLLSYSRRLICCCDTLCFVAGQLRCWGDAAHNLEFVCEHVCPVLHSPAS